MWLVKSFCLATRMLKNTIIIWKIVMHSERILSVDQSEYCAVLFYYLCESKIKYMSTLLEQATQLGLTKDELEKIKEVLGRDPNFNELAVYSVMWSEHCSYKNSIKWLKTLPKSGKHVMVEAGEENAGLIDIGDGYACSFKIESHNHPSAIEPFQGAATGVGGIHRDIFTMGARPIAALNSLRFGKLEDKKTQWLLKGVVSGIGHYGNCFGVPTVAGEAYFEECYLTNPLVNAMSVGVVHKDKTISAISYGAGNPVFIVGADTGKDGIGGASFASADITEDSAEQLPAVQVGDPFQEKKLLEACMELAGADYLIGMQDMGAAGISCSSSEMSAKGEHGMDIHLDKVPLRQKNMLPWEMLLSESQERMLVVVKKGSEQKLIDIFKKWDVHCAEIGTVTEGNTLNYFMNGEVVASLPADSLVLGGGAPVYERAYTEPKYMEQVKAYSPEDIKMPEDFSACAKRLLAVPNIASKRWIYEQYDSMVGSATMSTNEPSEAAMVWVKETGKGLALTVDCNSRYVRNDPYKGAMIAVAEAARNISCTGATPAAITNCLNFGNPYNEEVYYQFVNAIKGMSEACIKLETPVTGGNVSFYNQWEKGPVHPTPTIGMVGVMEDPKKMMTMNFKKAGDTIFILGKQTDSLGSSEYLSEIHDVEYSNAPHFDIEEEVLLQKNIRSLIEDGLINSAHDIAEGGMIIALVEMGRMNKLGFDISQKAVIRKDAWLFGESQSRIIVTVSDAQLADFQQSVEQMEFEELGKVSDGNITVDGTDWGSLEEYSRPYDESIESQMN